MLLRANFVSIIHWEHSVNWAFFEWLPWFIVQLGLLTAHAHGYPWNKQIEWTQSWFFFLERTTHSKQVHLWFPHLFRFSFFVFFIGKNSNHQYWDKWIMTSKERTIALDVTSNKDISFHTFIYYTSGPSLWHNIG